MQWGENREPDREASQRIDRSWCEQKIITSQGVNHTQHADDVQPYTALSDTKPISTLRDCFEAVQHWLDLNGLSMNPDKTEAMVVGNAAR